MAYHRSSENKQQGCHIDRELEEEETLQVLIQRPSPHHGIDDASEGIVEQRHVAGTLGYTGSGTE